jgi:anti-sigma factor RsiW
MPDERREGHLSAEDVAAYVDRGLAALARAGVEEHLAACAECRAEVVAVARLARGLPVPRRWTVLVPLAAAAAVLVLYFAPWQRSPEQAGSVLREPAVTTTVAPRPVAPLGAVAALPALLWTSVPHADRYRVTVFDSNGSVVWETQVADTVALLPHVIALRAGVPYFWKVAARTGWDRWVASDLTSFTLGAPGSPR